MMGYELHNLKEKLQNRLGINKIPSDQEIEILLHKFDNEDDFFSLTEKAKEIFSDSWTGYILEQKSITDDLIVEIQTLKKRLGI